MLITDEVAVALSRFVDGFLGPTSGELTALIERSDLSDHDPMYEFDKVSKAARVQRMLMQARAEAPEAGSSFAQRLLEQLRALGSFDPRSEKYPGSDAVGDLQRAFDRVGYELTEAGDLHPRVFGRIPPGVTPEGIRLSLERTRRNAGDPAVLAGGAKELIEGVARLIHDRHDEGHGHLFKTTLTTAFQLAGLADPEHLREPQLPPRDARPADFEWRQLTQALFELALAVNAFRNEHGTGHGRLDPPSVSVDQALVAAEAATAVASVLLHFDVTAGQDGTP